jgi:hypothetical protein
MNWKTAFAIFLICFGTVGIGCAWAAYLAKDLTAPEAFIVLAVSAAIFSVGIGMVV